MMLTTIACDPVAPVDDPRILWRLPWTASSATPLSPAANGDRSSIYFASESRLRKVRGADGVVVWDVSMGVTQPVVPGMNAVLSADVVAVTRVDVAAFDTVTGAVRWLYMPAGGEETGGRALAANDSTVFAAGREGRVHAIDARTGVARWVRDLSNGISSVGVMPVTADEELVYVCTKDFEAVPQTGVLWALDLLSGSVRWSYPFTAATPSVGSSCYGYPALWGDLVIQPDQGGRVFAFRKATGAVEWMAPMVDPTRPANDQRYAVVGGSTIVVTSLALGGSITGYDAATGTIKWRKTEFGGSIVPPSADSASVFVDHGWVFAAYDLSTGNQRWAMPPSLSDPETVLKGTAAIGADRVFIAGRDGSYAIRR